MEQDRETILRYLPEGWEEAAKREGALQRSRKIKTAEDLLYLVLLYLTGAGSFQNASTLMRLSTDIRLNKEAVRKRIMGCWKWLRWIGHRLCLRHGYAVEKPAWLGERRVLLVDATDMALRGSGTSDYRLHYAFDLFGYSCAQMALTDSTEGERLSRYELRFGDIVVADRAYGTVAGMEYTRQAGADFLVRLRTNAFKLYDEVGGQIDLMPRLRALGSWEELSLRCFYRDAKGVPHPVRIVATRKDDTATQKANRRLSRTSNRKQWNTPKPQTQEMAGYIVLATSLSDTATQVLELYRARWQIEQVFHRLKGLFSFGEPPGTNPNSVKAWFYGKLLVAALCEAMAKEPSFFPQ